MCFYALHSETRDLWGPVAACLPVGAYLAGGSALALRLAHRRSCDLDLFSPGRINAEQLIKALGAHIGAAAGLGVDSLSPTRVAVRVSGTRLGYTYDPTPLISPPIDVGGIPVATIDDIAAMRVAAVGEHGALGDWYDLMMIERRTGMTHRDCYLLYRQRFASDNPAAAALVADRLCTWRPGMGGLAPDPHLCDLAGDPVKGDTVRYWAAQAPVIRRQLSDYRRSTPRTAPPGLGNGVPLD